MCTYRGEQYTLEGVCDKCLETECSRQIRLSIFIGEILVLAVRRAEDLYEIESFVVVRLRMCC